MLCNAVGVGFGSGYFSVKKSMRSIVISITAVGVSHFQKKMLSNKKVLSNT